MSRPQNDTIPREGNADVTVLRHACRTDPVVRAGLTAFMLFVGVAALTGLGNESGAGRWAWIVFAVLTFWALRQPADRRVRRADDSVFWSHLRLAVAAWLGAASIVLVPSEALLSVTARPSDSLDLAAGVLRSLSYVGLYLAIERQPHRRHRWRPIYLEQRLLQHTVWLVVAGLLSYFLFLPFFFSDRGGEEPLAAGGPLLVLGGFLSIRLVYLVHVTGSRRWRPLYLSLAFAVVSLWASDTLAVVAADRPAPWPTLCLVSTLLPLSGLLLAARARNHALALDPSAADDKVRFEEILPGPLGHSMIFALLFPLMHYAASITGGLDERLLPHRDTLVFLWLAVMGGLAFLQHRTLGDGLAELRDEYAKTARKLRRVELNIRAHNRSRKERATLNASNDAFAQAFEACPDVIAIASAGEGRLLDVNESFYRIMGLRRHEILGRTLPELGVRTATDDLTERLERLRRGDSPLVFEGTLHKRSGYTGRGLFFVRPIVIDEQPYLLLMIRDITYYQRFREELELGIVLLEGGRDAIVAADSEGKIVFWNAGAQRLLGATAEQVMGRPLGEVPEARQLLSHAVGRGSAAWRTVVTSHGGQRRATVVGHTIPVLERSGEGHSVLFVLTEPAGEDVADHG